MWCNNAVLFYVVGHRRITRASTQSLFSSLPDPKSQHAALKISQQEEGELTFGEGLNDTIVLPNPLLHR